MHHVSTQKSVLRGALHSVYDSYICQNKLHNYIHYTIINIIQSKLNNVVLQLKQVSLEWTFKEMSDFALHIWSGSLFQSTGPTFKKARSPPVTRDVGSSTNLWSSKELEHSILPGLECSTSSDRWAGAIPFLTLYISVSTLKIILHLTGSQCKSWRTGVICSLRGAPVNVHAAEFWSFWTL